MEKEENVFLSLGPTGSKMNEQLDEQRWKKYIYSSTALVILVLLFFLLLYTPIQPHFSSKYCTFHSTTFMSKL